MPVQVLALLTGAGKKAKIVSMEMVLVYGNGIKIKEQKKNGRTV